MGLMSFLNLEGLDVAAFVVSGIIGYFVGTSIPDPTISVYASILVAYHLFLAWLVVSGTEKAGISLPIVSAILTHAACMVVVIAPVAIAGHSTIRFRLFRYGIAALALFERGWLFTAATSHTPKVEQAPAPVTTIRSTPEDHDAWLQYLATRKPGTVKPGTSVQAEYQIWLAARHKARMAQAQQPQQPQ